MHPSLGTADAFLPGHGGRTLSLGAVVNFGTTSGLYAKDAGLVANGVGVLDNTCWC